MDNKLTAEKLNALINKYQISNTRNQYGVKDCSTCYITIKGEHYIQWTDCTGDKQQAQQILAQYKNDSPNETFVMRKIYKSFYRIYKKANN